MIPLQSAYLKNYESGEERLLAPKIYSKYTKRGVEGVPIGSGGVYWYNCVDVCTQAGNFTVNDGDAGLRLRVSAKRAKAYSDIE